MTRSLRSYLKLTALALLCTGQMAFAQSSALDADYPKVVFDQDIHQVMRDFSKDLDVTVVVDRSLTGAVRQVDVGLTARRFLDKVAASLSASWFYSNGYVYLTPLSDVEQTVFNVAHVSTDALDEAFAGISLQGDRPVLSYGPGGRIAFASGAPALLRLVTDIVELEGGYVLDDEPKEQVVKLEEAKTIQIFRARASQ